MEKKLCSNQYSYELCYTHMHKFGGTELSMYNTVNGVCVLCPFNHTFCTRYPEYSLLGDALAASV